MKARIIMALIAFVLSVLAEIVPKIINWSYSQKAKRRARREEKLRKMEAEAIDVEWCFV